MTQSYAEIARQLTAPGAPFEIVQADGQLGERVKAIVRRVPGSALGEAAVQAHVAAHLARFKVPEIVGLTEALLPRNAAGKLLENALRGKGAVPFDAASQG